MTALEDRDPARGLDAFDRAFWSHVGHSVTNAFRAWGRAWTGGIFAPVPAAGSVRRFYQPLGRYASAFALATDIALLSFGGALKRKEMITARFGDILSELYLSSAVLKRWEDEGRQEADLPLVEWCMETGFATIEARFDEIFSNFPNRPAAWLLRFLLLPLGPRRRGPSDPIDADLRQFPAGAIGDARPHSRRTFSMAPATTGSRASSARSSSPSRRRRCAIVCARRVLTTSIRRARRA